MYKIINNSKRTINIKSKLLMPGEDTEFSNLNDYEYTVILILAQENDVLFYKDNNLIYKKQNKKNGTIEDQYNFIDKTLDSEYSSLIKSGINFTYYIDDVYLKLNSEFNELYDCEENVRNDIMQAFSNKRIKYQYNL